MDKLIYGFHAINSYFTKYPELIKQIYYVKSRTDKRQTELINNILQLNISLKEYTTAELDILVQHNKHQGIAAIVKTLPNINLDQFLNNIVAIPNSQLLMLDNITDPQNLGAIIRTAVFFGVDGIIIPKHNSANIDNPVVAKTSSGTIYNIPVIQVNNLHQAIDKVKQHDFWVVGTTLSEKSTNLFESKLTGKLVWVMGSEGSGMSRLVAESCDYLITIPNYAKDTLSLNVSVATGVVLGYYRLLNKI
jgi:23S rRNA (guanosine2251-2'-O)-methyltransferase